MVETTKTKYLDDGVSVRWDYAVEYEYGGALIMVTELKLDTDQGVL